MQTIFYPGFSRSVARARYGIVVRQAGDQQFADMVVINTLRTGPNQPTLWSSEAARTVVLNKLLSCELQGISIRCIRFFALLDARPAGILCGVELPIRVDLEDYRRRGNPVEISEVFPTTIKGWMRFLMGYYVKRFSTSSNMVGGCARCYTDFERRRHLPLEEVADLCRDVGYQGAPHGIPAALIQSLSIGRF